MNTTIYYIRLSTGYEFHKPGKYSYYLSSSTYYEDEEYPDSFVEQLTDEADSAGDLDLDQAKKLASQIAGVGHWMDAPKSLDLDLYGGYVVCYTTV